MSDFGTALLCERCGERYPWPGSHLCQPRETFPRGPSNEQTLITELGEARRQLESSRRGWQGCIDDLKTTEAERDALQAFKDWVHAYLDTHGVPHHPPGPHGAAGCRIGDRMDWLMEQQAELKAIDEKMCADYSTMVEQLAEVQAERDAAKSEVKRLTEIITGWRTEYDHKESVTQEQIKRLRESLAWFMSIDVFGQADEPEYDAARTILKETAL